MRKKNGSEKNVVIAARIPRALRDIIFQLVVANVHINESDFLREAIREKIQRICPQLYDELWQKCVGTQARQKEVN